MPDGRRIDLDSETWTVPAARMKSARAFTVPLSTGALDVLRRAGALSAESPFVFPSETADRCRPERLPACFGVPGWIRRYMGFRSSARSWMAESGFRRKSRRPV